MEDKIETSPQRDNEKIIYEELTEIRKQIKPRGKKNNESEVINEGYESPPKLRRSYRL